MRIKNFERTEKILFALFLIMSFGIYLSWSLNIPFGEAPDEAMRYQIPEFIFKHGYLPRGDDPEIINPVWGISYGFTPITTYIIQALFMKITSFFTMNESALILSARLVNILITILTLWICILIAQRLFKKKYAVKWLFLFLVALLPEFVFISSYVNMDALAVLSSAIIIYSWILGLQSDWDYKSCGVLAIGMSVCLLSYYNAYGFLVCSVLLFFTTVFCTNKTAKENHTLKKILMIIGIVLILSAWWFERNYILYDGDILGLDATNKCADTYADAYHKLDTLDVPKNRGQSLWFMLTSRLWLFLVARSFIGVFGHGNIPLSNEVYILYAIVFIVGIIGCFVGIKKFFPKKKNREDFTAKKITLFTITMLLAIVIPFLISMYYSYTADFQPQGRYAIPCIIPLMYFISIGFNKCIPKKFGSATRWCIVGGVMFFIVFFDIKILIDTIIPFYQNYDTILRGLI